jgi:nucleoside-diphosphate-sugar epimerase
MAAAYNLAMPRRKLLRINRDGSMILAEEAAAAGIRHFICCSTADTYGTQKEIPVRETCKQHPENDYAYSKLMAEQAVIRTGARRNMPVTILRPTMIYGPRAVYTASMFCTVPFIVHRRLGFFPHFIGGPLVNAVHAEDVAGAAVYALGRKNMAGHAFNVADDDKQSLSEFYYNIVDPLGVNWPPVPVPILKLPMRWACQLCEAVPGSGFDMLNAMLRLEWSQIVSSLDLVPALSPRFDKGFLSYGLGDHAFDNAKLKATGYRFRRPDFVSGYKDAVRWYRARRWIPEAAQLL